MDIIDLIIRIRNTNSILWIEEDRIKLFMPDGVNGVELKQLIREHKSEVFDLLMINRILSKDDFVNRLIFKTHCKRACLSFSQERLWFVEQYEGGTNAYHIPLLYELLAGTDKEALKYAIQKLVSRHEVLRSTIEQTGDLDRAFQVVHSEPVVIEEVIVTGPEDFDSLVRTDINKPFNLSTEYPIRVKFYTESGKSSGVEKSERVVLLINIHHIANDGWSTDIFLKELAEYYRAHVEMRSAGFELPPLEIQYKDYAVWQRAYLTEDVIEPQIKYWKDKLSGFETLALPTDYTRPQRPDFQGLSQECNLHIETSKKLRQFSQGSGTTLRNVLMASVNILLSKYTDQDDIVIGSPIANRHHQQTEGVIGFFVNMQAHRTILKKGESFRDLVHRLHDDQISAQHYQDLPFEKLVEVLGVDRDPSLHPIFQVVFSVENAIGQGDGDREIEDFITPLSLAGVYQISKLDLSISILDNGIDELKISVSYSECLFNVETISRLLVHYEHLLEQLAVNSDIIYSGLSLLNKAEFVEVINDSNRIGRTGRQNATINELFKDQVGRRPDSVAVVFEDQSLTYRELNEKSNQLARHLRAQYQSRVGEQLNAETIIGLYVDRSIEMIVGILAVLKAGGAYLPIDINNPQERIDYLIEDTKAKFVLSQRKLSGNFAVDVIFIDLDNEFYQHHDTSNFEDYNCPSDLAYVIYTSGTTGRPKGVLIEHNQLSSFVVENDFIDYDNVEVVAGLSNYAFDGSIFDIFFTLINGKMLVLFDNTVLFDFSLLEIKLAHFKVDTMLATTAYFNSIVQNMCKLDTLKQVLFGGESCNKEIVNRFKRAYDHISLIHLYGPTENIVAASYCRLNDYDTENTVPIGTRLRDKILYVLDSNLNPAPMGAVGELYVGGIGVARGYLNHPELTDERFILSPFVSKDQLSVKGDNNRLYKTGDMVKLMSDGNISYIGRNDDQVKIRGHRIELAEVEYRLSQQDGVKQCCVVVRELHADDGASKYLVGYFVSDSGKEEGLTPSEILARLSIVLPEFMVPNILVPLAYLPINANGKIDKQSLPNPDFSLVESYVAPSNQTERMLCEIWQKILKLDRVGMNDNFFRIGGNSILAIQLAHLMSRALGSDIRVSDVFVCKNLSRIVKLLGRAQTKISPLSTLNTCLSFSQERLWFVEQYEGGTNAYHIPLLYELLAGTDKEALKYAIQKLVSRHEVLRSTIEQTGDLDRAFQVVHSEPVVIEEVIVTGPEDFDSLVRTDINKPFNLSTEYPIRVKFYTESGKSSGVEKSERVVLLINIHHIANDGWSTDIFLKELAEYYRAHVEMRSAGFELPPLEIQYKDYAVWQRAYLTEDVIEPQIKYWKDKLSGFETLALPTDYTRPQRPDFQGLSQECNLHIETSKKLRQFSQGSGTTLRNVLMASVNILLSKYTDQDDIVIGSPIANRHHQQTEGVIGFFVNMQAHRTILKKGESFRDLVHRLHDDQISAQHYQDLPFEKLVEVLGVDRDPSLHPIFQVVFSVENAIGQGDGDREIEDFITPLSLAGVYQISKLDLSISILDNGIDELKISVSYSECLFNVETISRLLVHYEHLLEQLAVNSDIIYSGLSLLNKAEFVEVINDSNRIGRTGRQNATINELFKDQVGRRPDSVAVVFEDQSLTYRELNEKSNQLARHLRAQYQSRVGEQLNAETIIGLYVDRSIEMIVGILAVLKAGGAYLPIDINNPQERIDYLIEDTKAKFVLSQRKLSGNFAVDVIFIDLDNEFYQHHDTSNFEDYNCPSDLAYVIYTSGTTGRPKGVLIEHNQLSSFVVENDFIDYDNVEVVAGLSNYAFDGSIFDIFFTLINGKMLVLFDNTVLFDFSLLEIKLAHFKVDTMLATTAYFNSIVQNMCKLDTLKQVLFGGESCNKEIVNRFKRAYDHISLIHLYGPTENIVAASYCRLNDYDTENTVPIGTRLRDKILYVLDSNLNPAPMGAVGELYVGGIGVARGYLNHPELTDERFILSPFVSKDQLSVKGDNNRLYKTGDMVKLMSDGNISYIGRNDDQVKIRGHRIELAEVEYRLSQQDGVKQCCVVVRELHADDGASKYLVGYFVSDSGKEQGLTPSEILARLSIVLPEFMVPNILVPLAYLPINANGKIDKQSLPNPDFSTLDANFVRPETGLEIAMCKIYGKVLNLPKENISVNESFFRMGGNSLLTVNLKLELCQIDEFRDLGVADLFKYNSIRKLIDGFHRKSKPKYKLQGRKSEAISDGIAIIGYSGAFSGAENIDEFWQIISDKREGYKFFTPEECEQMGVDKDLIRETGFISVAGKINNIDLFDHQFWNMSPNEAMQLDPQIRKFMEHCWYVLEEAGYSNVRKEENIGVFAGSGDSSYLYNNVLNGSREQISLWEAFASNSKDAIATKVAFYLGLTGPANSVNTGCSTGLVTIVEACKNLQLGCCNMALAGGVTLTLPNQIGYIYQEGMIYSKNGHCRTFDKDASGTISGSGVGVVLLKNLKEAVKDGDRILAVIKGYCTNNDGDRKTGYTAPSVVGQSECIINAQKMAGITANQVDYVECHGTATYLGDSIEIKALDEAFAFNTPPKGDHTKEKTLLGAVKANIGHADSAAGVASLIKVCEMLRHNTMPAQLNFNEAHPELQLDRTPFVVPTQKSDWFAHSGRSRFAGVSSFGIGGTNAHVVVSDYLHGKQFNISENGNNGNEIYVIPVSAKSLKALEKYKSALASYLEGVEESNFQSCVQNIAYTLSEKREHFNFRSAYPVNDRRQLIDKLKKDKSFTRVDASHQNRTVFVFPGQGSQYIGMVGELYQRESQFREIVDQCIDFANPFLAVDLKQIMYPKASPSPFDVNQTEWAQIVLFVSEYSLARYLEINGVKPDMYIGHSIGEYVAATLSGVFDLHDAIKIVIRRGQLMQTMPAGSMLAIRAAEEIVKDFAQIHGCEIAAFNSREDLVVSGKDKSVKSLQYDLEKASIPCVRLNTSHAFHSSHMEEACVRFAEAFTGINLKKPVGKFISNLSGNIAGEEVLTPRYWCDQLRNPVHFAKGVNVVIEKLGQEVTFVEVGAGSSMAYLIKKSEKIGTQSAIQTVQLLPSANKSASIVESDLEVKSKEDLIAVLWTSGVIERPNKNQVFKYAKLDTHLPKYQFDFQKCWLEPRKKDVKRNELALLEPQDWFSTPVWIPGERLETKVSNTQFADKALIFLREDQLESFDNFAQGENIQIVAFDKSASSDIFADVDGIIRVNPSDEKAFEKLAAYINASGFVYEAIVHAASLDNCGELRESLYNSFYSLFLIRQYFLKSEHLHRLLVITNGLSQITDQDIVNPSNGALVGALRNINHEFVSIDARIVDVGYSSEIQNTKINQVALNPNYRKSEKPIAVRFGKIWNEVIQKIKYEGAQQSSIEDGDVILVTGGMGSVALSLVEKISQKHNVRFVLVSRSGLDPTIDKTSKKTGKTAVVEKVQNNGSQVDIYKVDLSCPDQVTSLATTLGKAGCKVTWIIHTAGVEPISVENYSLKNVEHAFGAKVAGIENILSAFGISSLRGIALVSSLASIMGDANRIEYCASNSYLDYLSTDRNRFGNVRICCINWPGWSDEANIHRSGSKNNGNAPQNLQLLMHLNTVSYKEGADLFYKIINQQYPERVIISKLDIPTLTQALFNVKVPSVDGTSAISISAGGSGTEAVMLRIFAQILGVGNVSINDDFFKLGGTSIAAIQVSHKISKALGCDIKVADIFKYKTVAELAKNALRKKETVINRTSAKQSVLSFAQERLWFIEQFTAGTNAYHLPELFELKQDADLNALIFSLRSIVARHEVLRSTINYDENKKGLQIIHEHSPVIEEATFDNECDYLVSLKKDINNPFDLSSEYPIRIKFYTIRQNNSEVPLQLGKIILLINTHHIASDGWSGSIFRKELSQFYEAGVNGIPNFSLPQLDIQYKDFAIWQRGFLTGDALDSQLNYWRRKLLGYERLLLPTDYVRPSEINYIGNQQSFTFGTETSKKLNGLARQLGVTPHSVMLATINILLSKYTGQSDIIIGTPIANRHHQKTEKLIGFFVNTLVVRTFVDPEQTFRKLVLQIQSDQVEAQQYQDLPFERLVDELQTDRDSSRHPIFQVMFGVQGFNSLDASLDESKLPLVPVNTGNLYKTEKFDLSITISNHNPDELLGEVSYATSLFKEVTISRLIDHYKVLVTTLLEHPDMPCGKISLLSASEYRKLLVKWNSTTNEFTRNKTIHQLFEEQAARTPDRVALVFGDEELTYKEVSRKSNQLARYIRWQYCHRTGQEVHADTLIMLYLDRGLEMVLAVLAVMKAGGAYVPIDPSYPQNRIDYLLENTRSALVLSQRQFIEDSKIQLPQDCLVYIDLVEGFYNETDDSDLPSYSSSTDLAYIIYTSGTTGKPKGVEVEHQNVVRLFTSTNDQFGFNDNDVWALFHSYAFDFSVWELWGALIYGGKLLILSKGQIRDAEAFVGLCRKHKVSVLNQTPSAFYQLVDVLSNGINVPALNLRYMILGGEALKTNQLFTWWKYRSKNNLETKLINMYGITETTVHVTYKEVTEDEVSQSNIGSPLGDLQLYVLNANLTPVPIGVIGELYVGGAGLSRGYLNNGKLTSERFIVNPFATESDIAKGYTRLYKTGDLVRWMDDGNIEYIGRNDDQVKIRGYRIELGEIEHSLGQLPGIRQCCVVEKVRNTSSGKTKHLVGYYIKSDPKADVAVSDLLTLLGQKLPEYMVPSALVELENFPLTINGKLDKQALPDPEHSVLANYVAPAGEIEKKLCGIWQEVLGLERVGTTDNFFRIGGDSILSIQLTSRIRQGGLPCQVKDIFEFKTIGRLAEQIDRRTETVSIQSEQGCVVGDCDLLPIQSWFFDQVRNGSFIKYNHWNQSFLIKTSVLELPKLQRIVQQLTDYHDVLRMRYAREQTPGGIQWKQAYQPTATVSELKTLNVKGLSVSALDEVLTRWQSDFDLEKGPLFQMGYLYGYEDESCRIYFALHHLVVDGVSWRILNEDIRTLYSGNSLSSKGSSYRQWVNNLKDYADRNPGEAAYWQQQLMDIPRYDLWEASTETLEVSRLELSLDLTDALLHQAPQSYHTEINDLLLTALAYALKNQNGYDVQGITLEGHGRESTDSSIDITRTVGWFTSLFPVRLELQEEVGESIQFIKESLRHIPNKGIGFGVFASNNRSEFSNENLPRITFNYMGQLDAKAGEWEIVGEPSGINFHAANRSHNLIDINGAVIGGRLVFSVATRLGKQNTEMLCESFRFHLHEVIEHCLGQLARKDSRYTPSDFDTVRISKNLLNRLQGLHEE